MPQSTLFLILTHSILTHSWDRAHRDDLHERETCLSLGKGVSKLAPEIRPLQIYTVCCKSQNVSYPHSSVSLWTSRVGWSSSLWERVVTFPHSCAQSVLVAQSYLYASGLCHLSPWPAHIYCKKLATIATAIVLKTMKKSKSENWRFLILQLVRGYGAVAWCLRITNCTSITTGSSVLPTLFFTLRCIAEKWKSVACYN